MWTGNRDDGKRAGSTPHFARCKDGLLHPISWHLPSPISNPSPGSLEIGQASGSYSDGADALGGELSSFTPRQPSTAEVLVHEEETQTITVIKVEHHVSTDLQKTEQQMHQYREANQLEALRTYSAQEQLTSERRARAAAESVCSELEMSKRELERRWKDSQSQALQWQAELDRYRAENTLLQESKAEQVAEKTRLSLAMRELETEVHMVKMDKESLQTRFQSSQEKVQNLQRELDVAYDTNKSDKRERDRLAKEVYSLREEMEDLVTKNRILEDEQAAGVIERNSLRLKAFGNESQSEAFRKALHEAHAMKLDNEMANLKLSTLEKEKRSLIDALTALKSDFCVVTSERDRFDIELKQQLEAYDQLHKRNLLLQDEYHQQSSEISRLAAFEGLHALLQADVERLRSEVEGISNEKIILKRKLEESESEVRDVTGNYERRMSEVISEKSKSNSDVQKLHHQISGAMKTIQELENERDAAIRNFREATRRSDQLQKTVEELQLERSNLAAQLERASATVNEKAGELRSCISERDGLQRQIDNLDISTERLMQQNKSLNAEIALQCEEKDRLASRLRQSEEELTEATFSLQKHAELHHVTSSDRAESAARVQRLETELRNAQIALEVMQSETASKMAANEAHARLMESEKQQLRRRLDEALTETDMVRDNTKGIVPELQRTINELRLQLDTASARAIETETRLRGEEREKEERNDDIRELTDSNLRLTRELKKAEALLKEKEADLEMMERQHKKLREGQEAAHASAENLQREVYTIKAAKQRAELDLEDAKARMEASAEVDTAFHKLQHRCQAYESELRDASEKIKNLQSEIRRHEEEKIAFGVEKHRNHGYSEELLAKLHQAEKEVKEKHFEYCHLEEKLRSSQSESADLAKSLSELKKGKEREMDELHTQCRTLIADKDNLAAELSKAVNRSEAEVNRLTEQLSHATEQIKQENQKIAVLQQETRTLRSEIETLKRREEGQSGRLQEQYAKDFTAKDNEIRRLTQQLKESEDLRKSTSYDYDRLVSDFSRLQGQLMMSGTEMEHLEARSAVPDLQAKLSEMKKFYQDELNKQIRLSTSELNTTTQQLTNENSRLLLEINKLSAEILSKDSLIKQLESRLNSLDPSAVKLRPALGVEINATEDPTGKKENLIQVYAVRAGGAAQRAGLESDDIIEQWNGTPITSKRHFDTLVNASSIGEMVSLGVLRKGTRQRREIRIFVEGTASEKPPARKISTSK